MREYSKPATFCHEWLENTKKEVHCSPFRMLCLGSIEIDHVIRPDFFLLVDLRDFFFQFSVRGKKKIKIKKL